MILQLPKSWLEIQRDMSHTWIHNIRLRVWIDFTPSYCGITATDMKSTEGTEAKTELWGLEFIRKNLIWFHAQSLSISTLQESSSFLFLTRYYIFGCTDYWWPVEKTQWNQRPVQGDLKWAFGKLNGSWKSKNIFHFQSIPSLNYFKWLPFLHYIGFHRHLSLPRVWKISLDQ